MSRDARDSTNNHIAIGAMWLRQFNVKWLYGFNPFPLRDFPYLVSLAGAEKITYPVRNGQGNMQTGDTGLIKKRRLRDITSGSRLVGFTILPVTGVSYSVLLYFVNTIFVLAPLARVAMYMPAGNDEASMPAVVAPARMACLATTRPLAS